MPGGDGTGPMGRGPMTGRGLGDCFKNLYRRNSRRFLRNGRGFGIRNFHRRYPYFWENRENYGYDYDLEELNVIDEKGTLKNQVNYLENKLKELKEELKKFDETK